MQAYAGQAPAFHGQDTTTTEKSQGEVVRGAQIVARTIGSAGMAGETNGQQGGNLTAIYSPPSVPSNERLVTYSTPNAFTVNGTAIQPGGSTTTFLLGASGFIATKPQFILGEVNYNFTGAGRIGGVTSLDGTPANLSGISNASNAYFLANGVAVQSAYLTATSGYSVIERNLDDWGAARTGGPLAAGGSSPVSVDYTAPDASSPFFGADTVNSTAASTGKPFSGYQPPSGYSPWQQLYTSRRNNGTVSPYVNNVRPALEQQNFNSRVGERVGRLRATQGSYAGLETTLGGIATAGIGRTTASIAGKQIIDGRSSRPDQVVDARLNESFRRELEASLRGSDRDAPKKSAKSLETWKPARVVPNTSRLMVGDKEELPLKGMQVDVRVDGFRARVLLDLYYFNDRPQQLEGNFQLRLPDEASPYFFAFGRTVYQAPQVTANDSMFFKPQQVSLGDTTPEKILALRGNSWEQPKVARMVPKEKAALAYRDTVRRRVDPALVEWSGAGVFQCRVFPLAPQSLHRVTIGYDVDLVRVGEDLELRLDLPGETPATIVDLNIAASDARQVSLEGPLSLRERARVRAAGDTARDAATLTPGPSPGGRGETSRLSYRLIDPQERPLTVRLRRPGVQMLTGADEATGSYFATRVGLALPEMPTADRAKQAIFLVDASLSAGPQFPLWTKLLRATLENNRDSIREFAVLFFNVETFWWQEKFVANTPENVEALMTYTDGLALEGATDLGRALKEAAAPAWQGRVGFSPSPDLFLLSDGAATWGEDRWALMAAGLTGGSREQGAGSREQGAGRAPAQRVGEKTALTPGPSPILPSTAGGRGEKIAPTPGPTLFAYRTGLAGGDPRFLAYLAEQTGGAVFSLVGEAEIASASVAHRNRPWRLTGIEMAGGHDLLVAGRPQCVFPGQQLLVVGRLEGEEEGEKGRKGEREKGRSGEREIVFTLQQGKATQTIRVKMNQVLASELAARTFGQVATSQLEDVALTPGPSPGRRGEMAGAEPVATAYARHFRVTGRTCSLLMLESEQDYARFNIKPEEDSFVVKDRPAGPIVAKALSDVTAALGDPKAQFSGLVSQGPPVVRGPLRSARRARRGPGGPAAREVRRGCPAAAMQAALRKDLPENLRQPWQTGLPDYETLAAEAQRRMTAYGADDALRALSSLVEDRPGDAALARDLAFSAMEWQRPGEAYHLLRRAGAARSFEPITFHAMAHCLEQMGQADLAIVYYELACGGQWDARFGDMHNIAQLDYLRFLRRVADGRDRKRAPVRLGDYAKARLATLAALQLRDTADVAALIFWNTDGTDVDLHVTEPSGEECFYQHTQTASGGHISRDVTTGFGPELYLLPKAPPGSYRVSAHYYASDANRASTRTKVLALIYEGWGTQDEKATVKALALSGQKENHELATVKR